MRKVFLALAVVCTLGLFTAAAQADGFHGRPSCGYGGYGGYGHGGPAYYDYGYRGRPGYGWNRGFYPRDNYRIDRRRGHHHHGGLYIGGRRLHVGIGF